MLGSLAAVFIFVLPGLGLLQYALRADPSYFLWKTYGFVAASALFLFIGAFVSGTVLTQSSHVGWAHRGPRGGRTAAAGTVTVIEIVSEQC